MASSFQSRSQQVHPKTGLLDLPPEVREPIYYYAMISELPGGVWVNADFYRYDRPRSITRVCRLPRAESLPIYYSQNRFRFQLENRVPFDRAVTWCKIIGDANIADMRLVTFPGEVRWMRVDREYTRARQSIVVSFDLRKLEMPRITAIGLNRVPKDREVELKIAFADMCESFRGQDFNAIRLARLMWQFEKICRENKANNLCWTSCRGLDGIWNQRLIVIGSEWLPSIDDP